MNFQGLYTALVTPFRNGKLDEDAFRKLVDQQIAAGVAGVVPTGTTGESPTLSIEEHLRVIELAVECSAGRIEVIAGTGANATDEAIELTIEAEKRGATASLQVCPYYNRPSQEGLYRHYRAIAEATRLPIMLYSIPSRCGVEIAVDTIVRLAADCPNITAVKEAGGDVDRVSQILLAAPRGFAVLSGDDGLALPFMACGATGLVSVASNLMPAELKSVIDACLAGDFVEARRLHMKYYPLLKTLMTIERNPMPIKAAMAMTGIMGGEIRLPLVELDASKQAVVAEALKSCGMI